MMRNFKIRQFHSRDMPMLYRICLLTGKDGVDASGTVDEDILGHIYAAPYATFEPDLCFVLTENDSAIGYILGTRDSTAFAEMCGQNWWPALRRKYPLMDEHDVTRTALLSRAIHNGYQPPGITSEYPAHLHIDILSSGQGMGYGRQLIDSFCSRLREHQVPALHFGVSKLNQRAVGFYKHLGFHLIETTDRSYLFGMHL
jgi:ribosomal protein S18 acetylase RimI-like enzyme